MCFNVQSNDNDRDLLVDCKAPSYYLPVYMHFYYIIFIVEEEGGGGGAGDGHRYFTLHALLLLFTTWGDGWETSFLQF